MSETYELLTMRHIQSTVASQYGVSVDHILSDRQSSAYVEPRHVAMYLCNKLIPITSLPQIGRAFKKDHTTVMHAIKRIQQRLKDDEFKSQINEIEAEILRDRIIPTISERTAEEMGLALSEAFRLAVLRLASRDPTEFIRRIQNLIEK